MKVNIKGTYLCHRQKELPNILFSNDLILSCDKLEYAIKFS